MRPSATEAAEQRYRIRWRDNWLVSIQAGTHESVKTAEEWTTDRAKAKTWTLGELTRFHYHIVAGYTATELEPVTPDA